MEYYTIEHYNRLYGWRRPWGRGVTPVCVRLFTQTIAGCH
jgi:hypothetical protein